MAATHADIEEVKEEVKRVVEAALFNTVRDAQNVAFTHQQYLKVRDMIMSGDTTDEQRVINAIAITSSQWARTGQRDQSIGKRGRKSGIDDGSRDKEATKDHRKQKCILPQSVQW